MRTPRLLFLLLVPSIVIAACARTSSSSSANEGIDAGTKTITVGASGPKTGPNAAFGEGTTAAQAEADYYNAKGGVNGWKIKYVTLDDGYIPANAIAAAHRLVDQEHVFAIVGEVGTPNGTAILPYMVQSGTPDIGFSLQTGSIAAKYKDARNLFGFQIPYAQIAAFDMDSLSSQLHVNTVSLAYQNDEVGEAVLPGMQYGASKNHINLAETVPVPDNATDFSGYAAKLKAANAPWVIGWLPPAELAGLVRTCASIGYRPHWFAPFFDPVPAVFNVIGPELSEGMTFESWLTPISDPSPGIAAMKEALRTSSTPDNNPSANAELGWIGMGVFIHALQVATEGGKTPTRQSVMDALDNGQEFEPGNVGFKLRFTPDSRIPQGSDALYQYHNGTLVRIYGPAEVPTVPQSVYQ